MGFSGPGAGLAEDEEGCVMFQDGVLLVSCKCKLQWVFVWMIVIVLFEMGLKLGDDCLDGFLHHTEFGGVD